MNQGVEWAVHACVGLAWLADDVAVPSARLAELYELPPAYLNKQLQALARAGIVESRRGAGGGFVLARPAAEITLLDVVLAVDGDDPAFRCTEIRQRGPLPTSRSVAARVPCQIAVRMAAAEQAWRDELAATTVGELAATVAADFPSVPVAVGGWLAGTAVAVTGGRSARS